MPSLPQLARARRLRAVLRKRKALEIGLDQQLLRKEQKCLDTRETLSSPQLARARLQRTGIRERKIGLD